MIILKIMFSFYLAQASDCKNMDAPVSQECFQKYESQFQDIHTDLNFSFDWLEERPQAFASGRKVVLSGGFARKEDLTQGGFLTVLCHEVGHAGFGFHEGEADDYASRICVPNYVKKFFPYTTKTQSLALLNFCSNQESLVFSECVTIISMLSNAANADRTRCLKNLKTVTNLNLRTWASLNNVPNTYHRCLLSSNDYPSFAFEALRAIHQNLISNLKEPLNYLIMDARQVEIEYRRHNSPQCRMDTFLAGALELDRPRCWSL